LRKLKAPTLSRAGKRSDIPLNRLSLTKNDAQAKSLVRKKHQKSDVIDAVR
jgi:hypothetical protein